jgi:hypothetical protein
MKKNSNKIYLQTKWYTISCIIILIVAAAFRFYRFFDRVALAPDQISFALVARYAVATLSLPFLGPFSSAGPFQPGGEWFWFVMLGTIWNPSWALSPWFFLVLLHIFFVYLIIVVGKTLEGKYFGIILGILSSVSTAQVFQSTNLTSQTIIATTTLASILFAVLYIQQKRKKYVFLLALLTGLGSSIHLQGIALIPIIPISIIVRYIGDFSKNKRDFFIDCILAGIGFLLPWLPIFWADYHNNFTNTKNMIYYYFVDQYRISLDVLGRRWLTFISTYIPHAWAYVIGGKEIVVTIIALLFLLIVAIKVFTKKIKREWIALIVTFFVLLVLVRYTRTPLFDLFTVILQPFILIFTALVIATFFNIRRRLGALVLLFIVLMTILVDIPLINKDSNQAYYEQMESMKETLAKKFPNKQFVIYDYGYRGTINKSLQLTLFLDAERKIDDNGIKIGMSFATTSAQFAYPAIHGKLGSEQLFYLKDTPDEKLLKEGWTSVTPKRLYNDTEYWYLK